MTGRPTGGSAGGHARAAALTDEQRRDSAAAAARSRWEGGDLNASQAERAAAGILENWAARADVDLARPTRENTPVDLVGLSPDLEWVAPIQLKGVARDGMTVHRKYVGVRILIVWVFLGADDGGMASRQQTTMAVLDPHTAWHLPDQLGMKRAASDTTFRWPQVTGPLRTALADHTACGPAELAGLLARGAPYQPQGA